MCVLGVTYTNFPGCFSIQYRLLFFLISSVLHWLIPPSKDLFVTDDAFEWIVFWLFALPIIRKGGLYDLLQSSLTTMRWFIRAKPHYVLHANICGGKKFLYQVISNLFSCRHCNDNKTETRRTETSMDLFFKCSRLYNTCTCFSPKKHSCVHLGAKVES